MSSSTPSSRQQRRKSYSEKLLDQRWQKKRLELLNAANWKCRWVGCKNENSQPTLHVHHSVYLRNTEPWEYEDWAYLVVCDQCHERAQKVMESSHAFLAKNPSMMRSLRLLGAYSTSQQRDVVEFLDKLVMRSPAVFKDVLRIADEIAHLLECQRMNGEAVSEARFQGTMSAEPEHHPVRPDSPAAKNLFANLRANLG